MGFPRPKPLYYYQLWQSTVKGLSFLEGLEKFMGIDVFFLWSCFLWHSQNLYQTRSVRRYAPPSLDLTTNQSIIMRCWEMSVGKCLVGKCQFDATEWFRLFSIFNSMRVQNRSAADLQIGFFKGCSRPTEAMPNVLYHPTLLVMTPPNGPIHWTGPQRPLRPYHTRRSDY